ncbi:hypothetical protein BJX76DRAFT_353982 [Aspergillus varians]
MCVSTVDSFDDRLKSNPGRRLAWCIADLVTKDAFEADIVCPYDGWMGKIGDQVSPVYLAARRGDATVVTLLLRAGADVNNSKGVSFEAPLMAAADAVDYELLLEAHYDG